MVEEAVLFNFYFFCVSKILKKHMEVGHKVAFIQFTVDRSLNQTGVKGKSTAEVPLSKVLNLLNPQATHKGWTLSVTLNRIKWLR